MRATIIEISNLIGLTFSRIELVDDARIQFFDLDGRLKVEFDHIQDCCEHVYLEDVCGDLNDLVGSPILVAEERSSECEQLGAKGEYGYEHESYTWTFYVLATKNGWVNFRWYGSSNGYYSEGISIFMYE